MAPSPKIKKIVIPEPVAPVYKTPAEQDALQSTHHLPELTKMFLFGGKAIFTVQNEETGEHMTFKVRGRESEYPKNSGHRTTNYFLNVKAPGGKYAYRYVGVVNKIDGMVRVTAKSDFKPSCALHVSAPGMGCGDCSGSKYYKVGAWACQVVTGQKMIPNKYHITHAGKCGICALTLTDPLSIQRGIGPECWKKVSGEN